MLPGEFTDAEIRSVTPVCPGRGRLGLGVDLVVEGAGVRPVRLAITPASAHFLIVALSDCINSLAGVQSRGGPLVMSETVGAFGKTCVTDYGLSVVRPLEHSLQVQAVKHEVIITARIGDAVARFGLSGEEALALCQRLDQEARKAQQEAA